MNEVAALKSLGLELPGPGYLFGAILFGLIGLAAFRYGRKSGRARPTWLGVALMLYPYAVSSVALLFAVGLALCAALVWWRD